MYKTSSFYEVFFSPDMATTKGPSGGTRRKKSTHKRTKAVGKHVKQKSNKKSTHKIGHKRRRTSSSKKRHQSKRRSASTDNVDKAVTKATRAIKKVIQESMTEERKRIATCYKVPYNRNAKFLEACLRGYKVFHKKHTSK